MWVRKVVRMFQWLSSPSYAPDRAGHEPSPRDHFLLAPGRTLQKEKGHGQDRPEHRAVFIWNREAL